MFRRTDGPDVKERDKLSIKYADELLVIQNGQGYQNGTKKAASCNGITYGKIQYSM